MSVEVETLVTRLVGEGRGLQTTLNDAIGWSKTAASAIETGMSAIQSALGTSLKNAAAWGTSFVSSVGSGFSDILFDLKRAAWGITEFTAKLQSLGSNALQVGGILTALFSGVSYLALKAAGDAEAITLSFETMLGSAEEADDLLKGLTDFAIKTPYEMPEILQATRGLVQFGERGKELYETLEILGNAASGSNTNFGLLALVFNQVRGVGKLLTQDFRQLSTRGVISLQDIAKHFNVTRAAAQKMLSKGQVSFEDLKDIFRELSSEGGRFFNMMGRQSEGLLGLWSTLSDNINIARGSLGKAMAPAAKFVTKFLIGATENLANLNPALLQVAGAIVGLGAGLASITAMLGGLL